jgi:hypothetical protein
MGKEKVGAGTCSARMWDAEAGTVSESERLAGGGRGAGDREHGGKSSRRARRAVGARRSVSSSDSARSYNIDWQ